jgi:cystathionine gamma-synthase
MGGHSDVMGGLLCFARDEDLATRAFDVRKLLGASASPFNAWLILRGLRSLPARMAIHCSNAEKVAAALAAHPGVSMVHYPGLPSHPGHALATKQMRHPGGMLSFELAAGRDAALAVAGRTRLFHCATSLGGCESLIEHRASVEGANPVSPPGLLRLSVGLEHADDLVDDLRDALAGL